ncbi:MAG TPA: ATP-binding protein [Nannocystaceae bacterium]|nr:ATP-binding protein [Nannocystaceae bacterium]
MEGRTNEGAAAASMTTREVADQLAEVAADFARIDSLEELAGAAEAAIEAFIDVEYNGLYLWDDAVGHLRLLYANGFTPEEREEAERTAMERHPGRVFRTGELLHVPDTHAEPGRTQTSKRRFEVRARLFMPVMFREQVVGVYGLASSSPHRFSEQDIAVLRFLCRLSGVVYRRLVDHRAREEAESRARRELVAANELLEVRVRERTADLEAKNERLAEALATLHRAQEQLVQAEKMASLGLLVAGIAHELKNPLNFVNNFAELSLEFADELEEVTPALAGTEPGEVLAEVIPELSENLRRIHEHGRRADAIISAMLLHAREAGEASVADLNGLVRAHVVLAYQGFRAADRSFRAEIVEDLGEGLGAVPLAYQELSRVVMNLVANACHALRERARREGAGFAPTITITTRREGTVALLRVADNGVGVAPEVRRRIFEPFFTTKPPGEGTGLGLSICYDVVVKQLGGRIEVDGGPGEGCAFSVRFPLRGGGGEEAAA